MLGKLPAKLLLTYPGLFSSLAKGHFFGFSVLLYVHLNSFSLAFMMQSTQMSVCVQNQLLLY